MKKKGHTESPFITLRHISRLKIGILPLSTVQVIEIL
jgi:hypothetical protein